MIPLPEQNYIRSYESALIALRDSPNDRELQHAVVLSLARMGSLEFAIAEYARFGLHEVRRHEDIMALGARLSKDLFLLASGKQALEHARDSANKYEAAFKDSGGYYSGINSATMALLAGMPPEMVSDRVDHIFNLLPLAENVTATDHYFIEATRAECLLLKRDVPGARQSLRAAIAFDPLNYAAHASTVKQFRFILSKYDQNPDWLTEFSPPKAVHYAGHIWGTGDVTSGPFLSEDNQEALALSISDNIQIHDIGFGYGSLASGADIVIAETLLDEGAELHVILPCDVETFKNYSVHPFGDVWLKRFHECMARAASITTLPNTPDDEIGTLNILAARIAMGQAVLKGEHFDGKPSQFLVYDDQNKSSFTAQHARDWVGAGYDQIVIKPKLERKNTPKDRASFTHISALLSQSGVSEIITFKSPLEAVNAAADLIRTSPDEKAALHMVCGDAKVELAAILNAALPGGIFVSEAFACCIILAEPDKFKVQYAGQVGASDTRDVRVYKLQIYAA